MISPDPSVTVSVVIPTFNRRQLVERAVRSVLAQTHPIDDIVVVDDGSTDGTGEALTAAFGNRIRYVWQANRGVAAARNHGLRLARGEYLTLLDSDDEWLPDKTARQLEWLQSHRDFGMVLCDVIRRFDRGEPEIFRRRALLPEDGDIFKWVLLAPNFVPASAMLRRVVYESVGEFDETLPTAEDLDYHLRVAARWKIGLIEQPLVAAMRGHGGLSNLPRSYEDYARVIEAAVRGNASRLTQAEKDRALARAYARTARGLTLLGRPVDAWTTARKAWRLEPDTAVRWRMLALLPLAMRRSVGSLVTRGTN